MGKKGLPKSKAEAESLIVEHQDWKVKAPKLNYTLTDEEYIYKFKKKFVLNTTMIYYIHW